jgi:hypothetical protein
MPIDSVEELAHVGEAIPYTYIGDSHCGTIGTRIFEDVQTNVRIVTRIAGIWRFVASDVLSEDGMIGDQLMQTLRRAGAFQSYPSFPPVPGFRPVVTTYDREQLTEQIALTDFANEYPYVLSVGEINDRNVLKRLVDDEVDFEFPVDTTGLERLPETATRRTFRFDQMLNVMMEEFGPLFRGLKVLRDAGLRSIFLHSVPPPAVSDEDSARVLHHPSPPRVRYKLAMFTNFLYERVCRDIGIGFINTWPMVTEGNLLKSEYYLDGLHLNYLHSLLSVRELHRQFTELRLTIEAENVAKDL